jgi:drug/metabolite transporter (DMT)-like permease
MDLFFLFTAISVLSYGIQLPLLSKYARDIDSLSTTIYRNVSLIFTMAPVLFFVPKEEFSKLPDYFLFLLLTSGSGALAFVLNMAASTYLPISISSSLRRVSQIITAVVLGMIFFNEYLQINQLILITLMTIGAILLTYSKPNTSHLEKQNVFLGVLLGVISGAIFSISFLSFAHLSRNLNPLLASYALEAGVGIFAVFFGIIRFIKFKKPVPILSKNELLKITLISATTISGTIFYGLALNHGPCALIASLMTLTGVIALIMGYFLFKEKLTKKQIYITLLIPLCAAALKFLS